MPLSVPVRAPIRWLALAGLLAGAGCDEPAPTPAPPAARAGATASPAEEAPLADDVALGQTFAISFAGREVTPEIRHLIVDDRVGTVLLFPSNFTDIADLRRLVDQLERLGREAGLPAPLLVTTDQEGGEARTLATGVPDLPAPADLAAGGPAEVRTETAATARAMRDLHIRLDLAPVADLRTNREDEAIGDRSFGSDAAEVGPLVAAAVRGLHDGGVGATLKHFPGLGGAAGDPHHHVPVDPVSGARWTVTQRASFEAGVRAGADAVMTTAVRMPGLDPDGPPALFSRPIVQGRLREELGFDGVIVTDSLSLAGIGERYPLPEAALAAARAGNDLLLLSNSDPVLEDQAIAAVRSAVRGGSVPAAQVRRSAERVLALNRRWPVR